MPKMTHFVIDKECVSALESALEITGDVAILSAPTSGPQIALDLAHLGREDVAKAEVEIVVDVRDQVQSFNIFLGGLASTCGSSR